MPIFTVDKDRRRLDLEGIIKKLRTVTTAVQILPFIYCTLYILSVVIYFFGSDTASSICDTLLYVSPITIASFLVLSSVLRLCKWHKTACVIPLIPNCISLFDYYIVELSEIYLYVELGIIGLMTMLLLISAYNVFLK